MHKELRNVIVRKEKKNDVDLQSVEVLTGESLTEV